jgi:hypothetical protein
LVHKIRIGRTALSGRFDHVAPSYPAIGSGANPLFLL